MAEYSKKGSSGSLSIEGCLEHETHPSSIDSGAIKSDLGEADQNDLGNMNPIPGADGSLSVDKIKKT